MGKCQSVLELEMVSFQPKVMHTAESLSKNNVMGERIASNDKEAKQNHSNRHLPVFPEREYTGHGILPVKD